MANNILNKRHCQSCGIPLDINNGELRQVFMERLPTLNTWYLKNGLQ